MIIATFHQTARASVESLFQDGKEVDAWEKGLENDHRIKSDDGIHDIDHEMEDLQLEH